MKDAFKVTLVSQTRKADPKTGKKKRTRRVISNNYEQKFEVNIIKEGKEEMKLDMSKSVEKAKTYDFKVKIHKGNGFVETSCGTEQEPIDKFGFNVKIHNSNEKAVEVVESEEIVSEIEEEIEPVNTDSIRIVSSLEELEYEELVPEIEESEEETNSVDADEEVESEEESEEETYPDDADSIEEADEEETEEIFPDPEASDEDGESVDEEEYDDEEDDYDDEDDSLENEVLEEDKYNDIIPNKYRSNSSSMRTKVKKKIEKNF